jgi:hypothetical protein
MAQAKVGGEIDAICTRCKMLLAHTILAMVGVTPKRVRCNTCMGEHVYRAPADAPKAKPAARAATAEARTERVRLGFAEQITTKIGAGKPYSPKAKFIVDEVVLHPTFGRGYVETVREDKIDIVFATGMRTLVHGRG